MTALTNNRYTKHRDGLVTAHPVKSNACIYKGGFVCVDETGYAVPGDDKDGLTFTGVALECADNTGHADGDMSVRVQTMGVFSFNAEQGTSDRANVGKRLYIVDSQTVSIDQRGPYVGRMEAPDGTGYVWIRTVLN